MHITRDKYLEKIKAKMNNGLVKTITGIRRCGKSYLLHDIFIPYLKSINVDDAHVIYISLDELKNIELRETMNLYNYIIKSVVDEKNYYVIIDEVQLVDNFWEVLNSLLHYKNVDVYATGSNSKFLSKDIMTNFRGRSDEVRIHPLTFKEYIDTSSKEVAEAYGEYEIYGGMPGMVLLKDEKDKREYLTRLFKETYYKDIIERYKIKNLEIMDELLNVISSSVGSYTNANRLINTFNSKKKTKTSINTINNYLEELIESFIISSADKYDIRGKNYINTPKKYYFEDIGLRNARLNFRQIERGYAMENIIYNELIARGYNVDVGMVEINEKNKDNKYVRKQLEVDFIVNLGRQKYYIQSAYDMSDENKRESEYRSLRQVNDSFKKFVIRHDNNRTYINDYGIINLGFFDFLLNEDCFNFD
ncbi:MAG: ATP-binding protein [Lachnospiraceae bacterium]|nr:ATP-binding protein [Lachnospiraceae bacterium]